MTSLYPEEQARSIGAALRTRRPDLLWQVVYLMERDAFDPHMNAQLQVSARSKVNGTEGEIRYFWWSAIRDLSVDEATDQILEYF